MDRKAKGTGSAPCASVSWRRALCACLAIVELCVVLSPRPAAAFDTKEYSACVDARCDGSLNTCTDNCLASHCSFFQFATLRCNLVGLNACNNTCFAGFSSCAGGCASLTSDIDPVATLSGSGHEITVSGPLDCDDDLEFDVEVTVTQRTSGALAKGRGRFACTAAQWKLVAPLRRRGSEPFQLGAAKVCALGEFRDRRRVFDAHQWCSDVLLSEYELVSDGE